MDAGDYSKKYLDDLKQLEAFWAAIREIQSRLEVDCKQISITAKWYDVLVILGARNSEPLNVGGLAREMGMKHHTAVQLAQRMECAGLITRTSDPVDPRRVLIQLTNTGRAKLEQIGQGPAVAQSIPEIVRKWIGGVPRKGDILAG
jgi:DNA-binding MarR family transcriptional regulator